MLNKHRTGACLLALATALLVSPKAQAHHGMDFITVQGWEVPIPLGAYLFTDLAWEHNGGDNEYGVEPGFMIGICPLVGMEVQTRFGKEPDGDWRYSSVTPSLIIQWPQHREGCHLRGAISAGYEFADELDEPEEEHQHEEGEHHEHEEEGHHHHGDGHAHGVDGFEGRAIIEFEAGPWLVGTNFIVDTDEDSDALFGYSAGVRYRVNPQFAAGVEAQGGFQSGSGHELIAAVYFEPIHQAVIKIGAGFGLTDDSTDFTLRTGFVWRF